jgi:hypothetical protein
MTEHERCRLCSKIRGAKITLNNAWAAKDLLPQQLVNLLPTSISSYDTGDPKSSTTPPATHETIMQHSSPQHTLAVIEQYKVKVCIIVQRRRYIGYFVNDGAVGFVVCS